MKRTLSLVLALVMVLGSFTTVFAAETATNAAAEFLAQEGVLLGNDDGDLMLEDNLERRNAVVLLSRLLGVEEEAAEFEAEGYPTWEDVDADPYYDGYLAWAEVNEYFQGDDEGNFNPRNAITAQEFAVVLLRALGYADVAWDAVMDKAAELELFADLEVEGNAAVVRGQMATMIWNALVAEEGKLAEKLGIELPAPAALEVAAVNADNLKEVEVVFNQEVDADTVTDANIKVKDNKGSVALKDDGVTAVITVDTALTNQKEYTLVVDKVETAEGVVIEKTELKFKAFDAQLPEALEVSVTGPRQLTITFSEPIKTPGKVVVKQDTVTLGNSVAVSGNKVNVTTFTNFVEGKEYEVTVTDFVDFADYKNIINVLTFTYEKDATPPVATVEKVEQTYVVVSFDKPVKGLKASSFYHTFSAWTAQNIYKDAAKVNKVTATDSVDKVYVYFHEGVDSHKAIPAGSTVFGIIGKDIKDNWGNALGNQEFTISATADRVAPEVKSIEVKGEDELEVTFTKDVTFARKNIEVLDGEGKNISGLYITVTATDDAAVYKVNLGKKLAGKLITVTIKDVEDTSLFKNVLSLYTEVLEVTDKTAPTVKKVYYKLEEGETVANDTYSKTREIYVQFSETVDPETALVASNYALVYGNKDVTILTAAPSFDVVDSRVKLPLTAKQANELGGKLGGTVQLQVINVKDTAGNTITPVLNDLSGTVALTETVEYTVEATTKKQVVVKFTDLLADVDPTAFTINGSDKFTMTQSDGTTTTLTFDLETAFGTDADGVTVAILETKGIKNSYGTAAKFSQDGDVVDKVKPEIAVEEIDDKDVELITVEDNIVTITFSEDMAAGTFSTLSFAVEGSTVEKAEYDAKVLTLTLKDAIDAGKEVRVSYQQKVTDFDGNALNLDLGEVFEVTSK